MRIYILGIFCSVLFPILVYSQRNVTEVDEGGSCGGFTIDERKCKEGLICDVRPEDAAADKPGVCRKPKSPSGPGEACGKDQACKEGLTCENGKCQEAQKTTEKPVTTTIISSQTITRTTVKPTTTVITSVQTTVVDSKTSLVTMTTAVSTDAPATEIEIVTNTAVVTTTPGKRPTVDSGISYGNYLQVSIGTLAVAVIGALLV